MSYLDFQTNLFVWEYTSRLSILQTIFWQTIVFGYIHVGLLICSTQPLRGQVINHELFTHEKLFRISNTASGYLAGGTDVIYSFTFGAREHGCEYRKWLFWTRAVQLMRRNVFDKNWTQIHNSVRFNILFRHYAVLIVCDDTFMNNVCVCACLCARCHSCIFIWNVVKFNNMSKIYRLLIVLVND